MNLRWIEREIPDSCKTEMVLQYEVVNYAGPIPVKSGEWIDVPIERLPKKEMCPFHGRGLGYEKVKP